MTVGSDARTRMAGFTLVEVMVALIVVSLAALAVHTQVLQSARNSRLIQQRTLASWIAMNKVTELRLAEGLPGTGRDDGELEYAGRDWVWESNVEPPSADVQNFVRIDVTVALADRRDEILASSVGFAGQGGSGALGRPFDTRAPVGGPGSGAPGDEDGNDQLTPNVPPGGRLTPRGEGT